MQELNGDYLDTTLSSNTYWYNGQNNKKTADFNITKLKVSAQNFIENTKWNLGGAGVEGTAKEYYNLERGTETYSTSNTCNDGACPRATEWIGKVALIYASDFGYATAGGTTVTRSKCLSISMGGLFTRLEWWRGSDFIDCTTGDWFNYNNFGYYLWTLTTTRALPKYATIRIKTSTTSYLYTNAEGTTSVDVARNVHPVVFLKSSIKITGGAGTETDPYNIT